MGSSYTESGVIPKYDKEMMELQDKVSTLQDEFIVRKTIEDDEARNLMLEATAKSYHHGLTKFHEKQSELSMNANQERQRINIYNGNQSEQPSEKEAKIYEDWLAFDDDNHVNTTSQEKEIEMLGGGKMKEQFPSVGDSSISVSGMVEKIDELATKVNNLESVVSSQIAIIPRLREERGELQTHIQSLENDKENLNDENNILNHTLKETEHKLKGLQELDHIPERRNDNFERFSEESSSSNSSSNNLEFISQSEKLSDLKLDDEIGERSTSQTQ